MASFNEDEYRDRQLDKYLEETLYWTSCCGNEVEAGTEFCTICCRRCTLTSEEDRYEDYMNDRADDMRDRLREEQ